MSLMLHVNVKTGERTVRELMTPYASLPLSAECSYNDAYVNFKLVRISQTFPELSIRFTIKG